MPNPENTLPLTFSEQQMYIIIIICPTDEPVTFIMSRRCLSVVCCCSPFILVHRCLLLSPQYPASHRCTNKLRCTVNANISELLPLSSFFLPFNEKIMPIHYLQNKVESLCCPTDEPVTFIMSRRCLSVVCCCSPFILVHRCLLLSPQYPASHRCTNKLRCTVNANISELLPLSSFILPFLLFSPPRFLLRAFSSALSLLLRNR